IVPPAMSTCAMIQPPKMSPFWLASAGIGMTRSAGIFPSGSFSTASQEMQRPAAEWREAGAEDQPGVDQVGVSNDHLCEHRFGFSQVRLYQRVYQLLFVGIRLRLHRFAVAPPVDALAGFLAELSELPLARENFHHRPRPLGERLAG